MKKNINLNQDNKVYEIKQSKKIIESIDENAMLKKQINQVKKKNSIVQSQIVLLMKGNDFKKAKNKNIKEHIRNIHTEIQKLNQQHIHMFEQNLKNQMQNGDPNNNIIFKNQFGLSPFQLMKITSFKFQKHINGETICMSCFEQLQTNSRCKQLPQCKHMFHSNCIKQHLLVSKFCPGCGIQVVV